MFFCDIFSAAGQWLRGVLACLCCLLLAGPILLIIGIVMLSTENTRAKRVAAFNEATASFDTTGMSLWPTAGGNLGGSAFAMMSEGLYFLGDTEGINVSARSYYGGNQINTPTTTVSFAATGVTAFSAQAQSSYVRTFSVKCTTSGSQCSSTDMSNTCAGYGGSYSGPSCSDGNYCGSCTVTRHLTTYCAVARRVSGNSWIRSTSYASCSYPFASSSRDQKFASSSAQTVIDLQLRDEGDPLIALERETEGTYDFGITAETQRNIGIGLLVAGVFITSAVCVGGFIAIRMIVSSPTYQGSGQVTDGTQIQMQTVPGQAVYPQPAGYGQPAYGQPIPQPGYSQIAPAYGQPAPAYGQPAPAYGQPAPAYGQPAPAYGQPTPAYGQPAPAYGQPAPAYGQPAPAYGQPAPAYGQPAPSYGAPPQQSSLY